MDKYIKDKQYILDKILKPLDEERKQWELEDRLNWYEQHLEIDTADYLRYLADHAVSVGFVEFCGDDTDDLFDKLLGEDYRSDNTYNYNEPFSRAMVIRASKSAEDRAYTIAFAPHYGGDVRGNYGDFVVLTFKDYWTFVEAVDTYVADHCATIEIDGEEYTITWTGGGDSWLIEKDGEYITDGAYIGGTTEDEIKQEIKEQYL